MVKKKGSNGDDYGDGWSWSKGRNSKTSCTIQQSGRFLVLDMLAKGMVTIHETCNGEQFVRLLDP